MGLYLTAITQDFTSAFPKHRLVLKKKQTWFQPLEKFTPYSLFLTMAFYVTDCYCYSFVEHLIQLQRGTGTVFQNMKLQLKNPYLCCPCVFLLYSQ